MLQGAESFNTFETGAELALHRSYCGNAKAVWFVEKRDMSSCLAKMARMATINYNSFFFFLKYNCLSA